jgi:uncharacterized membrane protein AbrB (regulator of aidB expression)
MNFWQIAAIYGLPMLFGYVAMRWMTKAHYPRHIAFITVVVVAGLVGGIAALGVWYDQTHVNVGEPD